ncbi:hypothetical protein [Chitinophaga sp.]|uniref:hypothetical protein n=1 Tax=Chitinophaga sp. TaxID=1869181 RepID=UPI0031E3E712
MKKSLFTFAALVTFVSSAFGQFPINTYIQQTSTLDPANNYTHLFTQWRYNTEQIGYVGYGSSNGTLYLHNQIGNLELNGLNNLLFFTNNAKAMTLSSEGRLGIGTDAPVWQLDVAGTIGGKQSLWLKTNVINSTEVILEKPDQSYYSIAANNTAFSLYNHATQHVFFMADANDNVGIGTADTKGHRLAVSGSIIATKIKVQQTPWPDYVFEPGYQLPSLSELEHFVKKNKHLPGVPSAEEVAEQGIDLGSNQAALLEKLEELTLIIIEQNKKLEAQEKRLQALEKKNG